MKKIFKLFLLFILFIPCVIKADMGSPILRPYQMVVINPNGLDCYDYNNVFVAHLNKNDVFTVVYEYDKKYSINFSNNKSCDLNSLEGTILVTDILNPNIAINEYIENTGAFIKKVTSNNEALVYADEGVDVRKGPAEIYEVVDHLDKGVKFKYSYYINGGGITHVYIDDGDTVGWVELFDSSLNSKVLIQSSDKYIVKKDINLDCGTISRNTILSPKYKASPWDRSALVEYNGCSKLVSYINGDIVLIDQMNFGKYISKNETTVYEYYDDGGNELTKIPSNTEFIVLANITVQGEQLERLYVFYNGKKGWVKTAFSNVSFVSRDGIELEYLDIFNDEDDNILISDGNVDNKEENEVVDDLIVDNNTNDRTPVNYTITYVIIAFVISLTAIVIIILINRKNN